jgi:hypothetical protein
MKNGLFSLASDWVQETPELLRSYEWMLVFGCGLFELSVA